MASNWPTSVDPQITDPTPSTREDVLSHAAEHDSENDQIHALQTGLGTTSAPGGYWTAQAASTVTGPPAFGAGTAVGTSNLFARQDHAHGLPANPVTISGTPAAVGQANGTGSSGTLPNSDHVHQGVTSLTAGSGISLSGGDGSGHGALTVAAASSVSLFPFPVTVDPALTNNATSTFSANTVAIARVLGPGPLTISNINVHVATSAGNLNVGIWRDNGSNAPGTLVAQSGSVACPAAGVGTISLGGSFTVGEGDWLGVAFSSASTLLRMYVNSIGSVPTWRACLFFGSSMTLVSNPTPVATNVVMSLWGS